MYSRPQGKAFTNIRNLSYIFLKYQVALLIVVTLTVLVLP